MTLQKKQKISVAIASTGTSFSTEATEYGVISKVLLSLPNVSNSPDFTFSITDEDSYVLYSINGLSKNSKYTLHLDAEVYGKCNFNIVLSGDAGSAGTAYITYFLMR